MTKTALALRHVHFEDLGGFEAALKEAGYAVRYCEMGVEDPAAFGTPDLLAILGGPIGAYEEDLYPFLRDEISLIAARLAANEPTLGICLGAQLMARALGAKVKPGRAKEIGWCPLTLSDTSHLLKPLEGLPVLHWHGDAFDLPDGAVHLASTPDCDNQAFAYGKHALAFQFHPEAQEAGFERWLIGHACEIAATPDVSVAPLREGMRKHGARAAAAGRAVLGQWLAGLA
jgi:GMP synthase (glutamine-hydrolysing)